MVPDDVKRLAVPTLAHRLVLRPEAWVRGVTGGAVVADVLSRVPTPETLTSDRQPGRTATSADGATNRAGWRGRRAG